MKNDKNYSQAVFWYRSAALNGHTAAQYNLALMLDRGIGTPIDHVEAHKWYLSAAKSGSSAAQNNLGYQFERGLGVEHNLDKAREWYQLSAKSGYKLGQRNLAIINHHGYGGNRNLPNALKWYRKAAYQGDQTSQIQLALMLFNGLGEQRNIIESMSWMIVSEKISKTPEIISTKQIISSYLTKEELTYAESRSNELIQLIRNKKTQKKKNNIKPLSPDILLNSVMTTQRYLKSLELYKGKVDGIMGPETADSILKFQKSNGLNQTKSIDTNLIKSLKVKLKY